MRGRPFNNSTQYFMRRISKAFNRLCCQCCCLCPAFPSIRLDELGRNGKERRRGEDLHIACGQVFLQDDAAAASLLVRSPPQTGTHTLLLLMHHKTNLSSETNLIPPPHFHIYLSNSTPIDPEDLISMVTRSINSHFGQQDEAVVIISWIDEHLHRRCRNE